MPGGARPASLAFRGASRTPPSTLRCPSADPAGSAGGGVAVCDPESFDLPTTAAPEARAAPALRHGAHRDTAPSSSRARARWDGAPALSEPLCGTRGAGPRGSCGGLAGHGDKRGRGQCSPCENNIAEVLKDNDWMWHPVPWPGVNMMMFDHRLDSVIFRTRGLFKPD